MSESCFQLASIPINGYRRVAKCDWGHLCRIFVLELILKVEKKCHLSRACIFTLITIHKNRLHFSVQCSRHLRWNHSLSSCWTFFRVLETSQVYLFHGPLFLTKISVMFLYTFSFSFVNNDATNLSLKLLEIARWVDFSKCIFYTNVCANFNWPTIDLPLFFLKLYVVFL